jgi:hypothetical protein
MARFQRFAARLVVSAGRVPQLSQAFHVLEQLLQAEWVPHKQVAAIALVEHEEPRAPESLLRPFLVLEE